MRHALVIMEGVASLHDLQTIYDSEGFEDLFEIAAVKKVNR